MSENLIIAPENGEVSSKSTPDSIPENRIVVYQNDKVRIIAETLTANETDESPDYRLVYPVLGGINNASAEKIIDFLLKNGDRPVCLDILCGEDDDNSLTACMALFFELSQVKSRVDIRLSGTVVPLPVVLLTGANNRGSISASKHTLFYMFADFKPDYLGDKDFETARANQDKLLTMVIDLLSTGRDRSAIEAMIQRKKFCTAEEMKGAMLINEII